MPDFDRPKPLNLRLGFFLDLIEKDVETEDVAGGVARSISSSEGTKEAATSSGKCE